LRRKTRGRVFLPSIDIKVIDLIKHLYPLDSWVSILSYRIPGRAAMVSKDESLVVTKEIVSGLSTDRQRTSSPSGVQNRRVGSFKSSGDDKDQAA
jgi:hypothetical protein